MIVACPECSARFRLGENRFAGKKRLTLRCARCRNVFTVDVSASPGAEGIDRSFVRVLMAHGDPQLCTTIEEVLRHSGMDCRSCTDGEQALSLMAQEAPDVLVLDVALPGLYAFEAVEKIRRLPGLEKVKILLVSSVYNKTAYKRTPVSLYGADDYIEKHHIPGDLVDKISQLLTSEAAVPTAVEPGDSTGAEHKSPLAPASFVERMKERILHLEELEGGETEEEKARRFARIIVADIALYSQPKVDEGIRLGTFFETLAPEIAEGRRLFEERFGSIAALQDDFLQEAFRDLVASRHKELHA